MSSSSIEFHKIWVDQCVATEGIRDHFGLESALDYLVGEKLFTFLLRRRATRSLPPRFRRSSPKSSASLQHQRSAITSTIWNAPSISLRLIRICKMMIWTTKSKRNLGRKIPSWALKNSSASLVCGNFSRRSSH